MSITPNTLKNKRKQELKELASDLGLNTKGLRYELEERIRIHLESENSESKTEEDATTSKLTPRRSNRSKRSISSGRRTRKDISLPPNGDRHSSDEENPSVSSESESKQDVTVNFIRTQNTSESEIIEPINLRGLPNDGIFRINNVQDFLVQLRNNISNSKTFCKGVIYMELAVFLYCAIDWSFKIASIPNPLSDSEEPIDVHIPDIFILMEWHRFWRPLISFIFYLLLLPLGFSYIFNFEPRRYPYSPLTFSVAQYAIFMVSIPNFDWAEDVRDFIPDSLIYTGALTGAIFALYESILENQ